MRKTSCELCTNVNCFVKMYCSPEWIHKISLSKSQVYFKQNQEIIKEGELVLGMFFIQQGKVKVVSTGLDGRQQIVRFANDGHILGHRGLGYERYPISAVAMEGSLVCFVVNDLLSEVFMANPKLSMGLMVFYSRELRKIETRMKNIAHMNLREKVAEALLLMMEMFGLNKEHELNVPFTREDIASTVGTNVEQISRQLTEFESAKLIQKRGRKVVILKKAGLEHIISKHFMQYAK
ncbi:MAG: Crp/Fnr family transcriptional regulator [Bacteroidetes bacterium]|nr:Crp/Fnr family transcriptional regulator [Bacteroidota bacterium]